MKTKLVALVFSLMASPCFAQAVSISTSRPPIASVAQEYLLGAGDSVRISVFNEPDLGVEQTLSASGEVSLPLIGDVNASGMSSAQLADALEERFRTGYLENPHVSVAVLVYRPIYVTGEVARPGAFPYAADMSVARAVATAGGYTRHASRSRLYLTRAGASNEEEVSAEAATLLAPGDTVRVGESFAAALRDLPLGNLLSIIP
jgi:protein involved in polysaccharide export with SLBB domain